MPNAIMVGATSGIGRALAVELSKTPRLELYKRDHAAGITGRREELVRSPKEEIGAPCHMATMDVTDPMASVAALGRLIEKTAGLDLLVISSGIGVKNPHMDWEPEWQTLAVNVMGFAAVATAGYRHFANHGARAPGDDIIGCRDTRRKPQSWLCSFEGVEMNYTEGLRARAYKDRVNLTVTDVRPGYVATPMTEENERMFWVASAETAARQIAEAIRKKKRVAYTTTRWTIIAFLARHLPNWVLEKI